MSSDALRSYIRTLRREQHLTQRQLANAVGVTEQLIATWERGILGSLKDDVLLRIAGVLHASLEDMIALETGRAVDAEEGERRARGRVTTYLQRKNIPVIR